MFIQYGNKIIQTDKITFMQKNYDAKMIDIHFGLEHPFITIEFDDLESLKNFIKTIVNSEDVVYINMNDKTKE